MGGGPYDRRATLTVPAPGNLIKIAKHGTVSDLPAALALWTAAGSRSSVIRFTDSDLYEEDFQITVPRGVRLALEAADGKRPVLRPAGRPRIAGAAGSKEPGTLAINGLLLDGGLDLSLATGEALRLEIAHSTLVPRPGRASLAFLAGGDPFELSVRIVSSIVGALRLPADVVSLELEDSFLDAASGGGGASQLPVLVSGALPVDTEGRLPLAESQEMKVSIGGSEPVAVRLRNHPASLEEARVLLQEALRAASDPPSFPDATVLRLGGRFLLVRSGVAGEEVGSFAGGPSAALQLTGSSTPLSGLLSGSLAAFPAEQKPQVQMTLGGDGPHTVTLSPWSNADQAKDRLQEVIQDTGATAAFKEATVEVLDGEGHLLVRPGVAGATASVTGLPASPDTIAALGLKPPIKAPEGTFVQGVFSGALHPFPELRSGKLHVTFGGTTRDVALKGPTGTLGETKETLNALPQLRADVLGNRLLVNFQGAPFANPPVIADTSEDPDTVRELALGAPLGENVYGLLSNGAVSVPNWTKPQLQVKVGSEPTPKTFPLTLSRIPRDPGGAREVLQAALAAAGLPAADVLLLIDSKTDPRVERLLVRAGGAKVEISKAGDDKTAEELKLLAPDARELHGLLSGSIGAFPKFPLPALAVTFGLGTEAYEIELSEFPPDLAELRKLLEDALHHAAGVPPTSADSFRHARVFLLRNDSTQGRLLVASGQSGEERVVFKRASSDPNTVLDTGLAAPPAEPATPLLSGVGSLASLPPDLVGTLQVTIGGLAKTLSVHSLRGTLDGAANILSRALKSAFQGTESANVEVLRLGGHLLIVSPILGNKVVVAASSLAGKLGFTSGSLRGRLSRDLAIFPSISGATASIRVEIDGDIRTVSFASVPTNLATAQAELQSAIQGAGAGSPFAEVTVQVLGNHLFVSVGNSASTIRFEDATSGPPVATLLELTDSLSRAPDGLLSGTGIELSNLSFDAKLGDGTARIVLDELSDDLTVLAPVLQAALRAAAPKVPVEVKPTFEKAEVFQMGSQLVVLAGRRLDPVVFTSPSPVPNPDLVTLLRLGSGVATTISGLLSGPLTDPPRLKVAPTFRGILGGKGPAETTLSKAPTKLEEARDLLQKAIRAAKMLPPTPSDPPPPLPATFTGATVEVLGDRLVVTAGTPSDAVVLEDVSGGGTAPMSALGLSKGLATPATGILSGDLRAFSSLSAGPRFEVRFGNIPSTPSNPTAWLTDLPTDLEGYRAALEKAVRAAHPDPVYAFARVRQIGDHFVVQPGERRGLPVTLTDGSPPALPVAKPTVPPSVPPPPPPLVPGIALDGVLSGDLSAFNGLSAARPQVDIALGSQGLHTVVLDSSPTNLDNLRHLFERGLRAAHSADTYRRATVQKVGDRLLITPGQPTDPIFIAPSAERESDLAGLKLDRDSLVPAGAFLTGPVKPLSVAPPRLKVSLGDVEHVVELAPYPADLAAAAALLQEKLQGAFSASGITVDVIADRLHVKVTVPTGAKISFAPVVTPNDPAPADLTSVFRFRLDTGSSESAAGLLSGDLAAFPELGRRLVVDVTIGEEGPYPAELPFIPFTPAEARDSLEQAVRSAHFSPAFSSARVILAQDDPLAPPPADPGHRLVLLPGRPGEITVNNHGGAADPDTAADLRLTASVARRVEALVSGTLPPFVPLTSPAPVAGVRLRSAGGVTPVDFEAPFTPAQGSFAAIAAALQAGIRSGASPTAASQALVALIGPPDHPERLVVLPGEDGFSILLAAVAADSTSVSELRLEAESVVGTEGMGPATTLVRSTVFGRLDLRELEASETLFTEPVRVERRHVGCARYSYLPEGSETPRRFRCQPDLALARTLREALETLTRERGLTSAQGLPPGDVERLEILQSARVHAVLVPRFTSTRWGQPGYGQLRLDTAREIATGAEDGSEIGAFQSLHEPARRRQLALLIEEYLRFGLDAGLFFLT